MTDNFDPAISGTTLDWVFSQRTQRWYPIIRGGAPEGDPGDGDGTPPASGDGTPPASGDPAGPGDGGTGEEDADKPKFTQAQVDAIATREAQKAARGKLDPKELGFESAKDMKDFIDGVKAKEESDKSEDEKARDQAIKEAADAARNEVLSTANSRLIKANFLLAATKYEVEFGEDAYALAQSMEGWGAVEVKEEDGTVSGFDEDFFKELKEKKPFLFKQPEVDDQGNPIPSANAGAQGPPAGTKTQAEKLAELYPALKATREWAKTSES